MEINDLQKASIDNQPLTQTILGINDLREFDLAHALCGASQPKQKIKKGFGRLD
jgi:hypothetical protein